MLNERKLTIALAMATYKKILEEIRIPLTETQKKLVIIGE